MADTTTEEGATEMQGTETTTETLVGQRRVWQRSMGNGWLKPVPVTIMAVEGNWMRVRDDAGGTHKVKRWNVTRAAA